MIAHLSSARLEQFTVFAVLFSPASGSFAPGFGAAKLVSASASGAAKLVAAPSVFLIILVFVAETILNKSLNTVSSVLTNRASAIF